MAAHDLLLPERAVLLHIGPHKTGTTALQGAMRQARPKLREHGVVYAGLERQHMFAALAVTGGKGLLGDPPMEMRHWDRLVRQVNRASGKRVVVSSEFFDGADDETARKVVTELDPARVHVAYPASAREDHAVGLAAVRAQPASAHLRRVARRHAQQAALHRADDDVLEAAPPRCAGRAGLRWWAATTSPLWSWTSRTA